MIMLLSQNSLYYQMSIWQFDSIKKEDLSNLAEIYIQAFQQAPWHELWPYTQALTRLTYFYETPGFAGWKAICDGQVGGFILGHRIPYQDNWIFDVKELCVLPLFQGQHLGTHLFKYMESTIQMPLSLYTHPHLKTYYERLGCVLTDYCMMSKKIG